MSDRHNYPFHHNQPPRHPNQPPRGSQWLPNGQQQQLPHQSSSYQQVQRGFPAAPSNYMSTHPASSSPYAMPTMPPSSTHYTTNNRAAAPSQPYPPNVAVSPYNQQQQQQQQMYPPQEYPMRQPAHSPNQMYPPAGPSRSHTTPNVTQPYVIDGQIAPTVQYPTSPTVQYPASPTRPFSCDMCALSFNRQHDLKRHRDTHSGEKPFLCNGGCGKTFTRKDALKRHQLVKHCGYDEDAN
ncbi:hypothetical protein F4604DRAFT_1927688 [Suillus subluteus]|nr:hypothetical protein F4604DRAFT_1927688 [Suillus subluteus]